VPIAGVKVFTFEAAANRLFFSGSACSPRSETSISFSASHFKFGNVGCELA
jgi:hypothetical protein